MNLWQELLLDGDKDIRVVTILPIPINAPIFQNGANYTGKRIKAPRPVYPVKTVVAAMTRASSDPQPEIYADGTGRMANILMKLTPGVTERMMTLMENEQEVPGTSTPSTSGNLFDPVDDEARVNGGWREPRSATPSGVIAKVVGVGAAIVPIAAIARQVWRRRA